MLLIFFALLFHATCSEVHSLPCSFRKNWVTSPGQLVLPRLLPYSANGEAKSKVVLS